MFSKKLSIFLNAKPKEEIQVLLDPSLVLTYVSRWPLFVHLVSAMACLGISAYYHLFCIHSVFVFKNMATLDYGGICFLIMGSSYPPIFYTFACEQVHGTRNFFFILITSTCTLTLIALFHPFMASPKARPIRSAIFCILGISAAAPFFYITAELK